MKHYSIFLLLLFFFAQQSFGQFKNTFASNGNPTTQVIDASGMKQGHWNYYDTGNQVFRTEVYTDNILTKSIYFLNGSELDIMGYRDLQLSELNPKVIDFIIKQLQPVGKGELIILQDGSVHLHFYLDKLKAKVPSTINLDPVKQEALKSSTIKF